MTPEKLEEANKLLEEIKTLENDLKAANLLCNPNFLQRPLFVKFNGGELTISDEYCRQYAKMFKEHLERDLIYKKDQFKKL